MFRNVLSFACKTTSHATQTFQSQTSPSPYVCPTSCKQCPNKVHCSVCPQSSASTSSSTSYHIACICACCPPVTCSHPALGRVRMLWRKTGNLDSGRIVDKACSIYEGSEQSLTFSNTVARRLQSSWGFHWICEHVERATGCGEWSFMSLLLVCKMM
jgi:hypothetical protein